MFHACTIKFNVIEKILVFGGTKQGSTLVVVSREDTDILHSDLGLV